MRVSSCVIAVATVLGLAATAATAADRRVLTIAGAESFAFRLPLLCTRSTCGEHRQFPPAWTATERRFSGTCLTHRPDGTILLCQDEFLFELTPDGLMRSTLRVLGDEPFSEMHLQDLAVDPDGALVAATATDVRRITGERAVIAQGRSLDYAAAVDVAADRTVFIAESGEGRILAAAPSGARRGVAHGLQQPKDVSVAPGGTVFIADYDRVRRVEPNGTMSTVAGGPGRRKLHPTAVHALSVGNVLIGTASEGLLRLGPDGRLRTVVAGTEIRDFPSDARAVTVDGQPVARARLSMISRIDVLPDGDIAVLTDQFGVTGGSRLALVRVAGRSVRLGVALPRANRASVRRGGVEIFSTRAARARVEVLRRGRVVVARRDVALGAGATRVRLPIVRSDEVHVLRASARTSDGRVASHRLAFFPRDTMTPRVARALADYVDGVLSVDGHKTTGCRRATAASFRCRAGRDPVVIAIRRDGLVDWTEGARREPLRIVLEPAP